MSTLEEMPEYQRRVFAERTMLDEKVTKLDLFLHRGVPASELQLPAVPVAELLRLYRQLAFMKLYLEVLDERIVGFLT